MDALEERPAAAPRGHEADAELLGLDRAGLDGRLVVEQPEGPFDGRTVLEAQDEYEEGIHGEMI